MTYTRSPRMMKRYMAGTLDGTGPVDCTPTRLRLIGFQPKTHVLSSGKKFRSKFSVFAIVVGH